MIGTKYYTEFVELEIIGRRAFQRRRSVIERERGVFGSENLGMSNEKYGQNPYRRKDKVSWGRFVRPG